MPCLYSQTEHRRSREPGLNLCTHYRVCAQRGLSNTSVENWPRFEDTGFYFRTKLVNVQKCGDGEEVIVVRGDTQEASLLYFDKDDKVGRHVHYIERFGQENAELPVSSDRKLL